MNFFAIEFLRFWTFAKKNHKNILLQINSSIQWITTAVSRTVVSGNIIIGFPCCDAVNTYASVPLLSHRWFLISLVTAMSQQWFVISLVTAMQWPHSSCSQFVVKYYALTLPRLSWHLSPPSLIRDNVARSNWSCDPFQLIVWPAPTDRVTRSNWSCMMYHGCCHTAWVSCFYFL